MHHIRNYIPFVCAMELISFVPCVVSMTISTHTILYSQTWSRGSSQQCCVLKLSYYPEVKYSNTVITSTDMVSRTITAMLCSESHTVSQTTTAMLCSECHIAAVCYSWLNSTLCLYSIVKLVWVAHSFQAPVFTISQFGTDSTSYYYRKQHTLTLICCGQMMRLYEPIFRSISYQIKTNSSTLDSSARRQFVGTRYKN